MAADLPSPVTTAIAAVNRGDSEAFVGLFLDDGYVDDNGRRFQGHEAIRGWSDAEFIGAGGRMTVTHQGVSGDGAWVDADFTSSGFNGLSRFAFAVDGGHLASMTITA
jgi:ketosteroid isomerase-like protein